MYWEIEIQPKGPDLERQRVAQEYDLLTHTRRGTELTARSARGYILAGDLIRAQAEQLLAKLLADPLAETSRVSELHEPPAEAPLATVLLKPGVMDPVA